MTKPKMYLAGPIAGLTHDQAKNGWRKQIRDALPTVDCLSPMRNNDNVPHEGILNEFEYAGSPLTTNKGLTTRDRFDVMRSDIVFFNLTGVKRISKGTIIELGWADAFRKPIVLCMEEGNVHDHAMIREMAGYIVPTVEEGIEVVKGIL